MNKKRFRVMIAVCMFIFGWYIVYQWIVTNDNLVGKVTYIHIEEEEVQGLEIRASWFSKFDQVSIIIDHDTKVILGGRTISLTELRDNMDIGDRIKIETSDTTLLSAPPIVRALRVEL
ncbi:hypothetical protein [Halalkalibacter hemicellulosilyticus]|uniref:Uncharacterized protein n=1 Tax=Halalkalibacter hemicellulosilyticusJCM 9152 TaxID=1236971 RepID=W4QGN7_9BACI|nr:hypothetical protein [Halalkalibacter hemicellulosilyticus]GAE30479.1 hypothetical protein JCM9152_1887 [Halalkalibacter hemicellulosilyticusJCM 9152]